MSDEDNNLQNYSVEEKTPLSSSSPTNININSTINSNMKSDYQQYYEGSKNKRGQYKAHSSDTEDQEQGDYTTSSSSQQSLEIAGKHEHHQTFTSHNDTFLSTHFKLSPRILDKIYPPKSPRSVQLLRKENIAIPLCYLTVGILQGLSGPFINVYPLFLGATEAQQITISSIRSLPASFKLLFGFWSDNVPFLGYRRKAYMFLGWATSSAAMLMLTFMSNLERIEVDDDNDNNGDENNNDGYNNGNGNNSNVSYEPPEDAPSIPFLTFTLLLFGTGFWFADVMGDSLVAEKAKLEPPESRGQLQSTCYASCFFGKMIAAPIATVLYSTHGPQVLVRLMGIVPMMMLYPIYHLWEMKDVEIQPTRVQCLEIWNTVCSRAVWQPMGFVYLYNVLQIGNAAWKEFLMSVLLFQDWQLNILFVVATVLLYLGVMAYKFYFIKYSWRAIYIGTTTLNTILSLLQLLLIKGITFGLSPFVFALGDDIFADFIAGVQFLPTTIMMVHLCPAGSEGASYAMFTTVNNCAGSLASALSTLLTSLPGIDASKETMVSGDLSGLTKLTLLTTALQTSGLLFVGLLPKTKDDLACLHNSLYSGSKVGGALFLMITISSVLWAIGVNLMNTMFPGWAGES